MIAAEPSLDPFTYILPPERIAQRPIHPPDAAKLLVVQRHTGALTDRTFADLVEFLDPSDLLIFNDTRVIPARCLGHFVSSEPAGASGPERGEASGAVEVFLLRELSANAEDSSAALTSRGEDAEEVRWLCTGKPLRKCTPGRVIALGGTLRAQVIERVGDAEVVLRFFDGQAKSSYDRAAVRAQIAAQGRMPIPPYIRRGLADEQDRIDYQTIFAARDGSIAAPTASLHFTPQLLERIQSRGIGVTFLTLHVGAASIRTVETSGVNGTLVPPGAERMAVPRMVLELVRETKERGGRVIAVGTTVARAIESAIRLAAEPSAEPSAEAAAHLNEVIQADTELFITPGFEFQCIDGLVTNFHQPGTTHMLLVEALLGRTLMEKVYAHALANEYRFLSYGDGSLLI